jgi:cell division protein FtsN
MLFVGLCLFWGGCASRGGDGSAGVQEILGGDVKEGRVVEGTIQSTGQESGAVAESRPGYRVQVVASTLEEEADGVAETVRTLLTLPVYVEYSEPLYRVRVGDFTTREEAEAVRAKLVDLGFESAWTVETEIKAERGGDLGKERAR